jgi:DNA-binding transcriptional ArsR family regulator
MKGGNTLTEELSAAEALAAQLAAIASVQRMRILAELRDQPLHVSELARRMQMSRALVYMHVRKLEEVGLVKSHLELGPDGKAMNIIDSTDFSLTITPHVIAQAIATTNKKVN